MQEAQVLLEQYKMNDSKKNSIGKSLKETLERRKNLSCKTYELKFDMSSLSKEKLDELNLVFTEAKWLYNHVLDLNKSEDFDLFKFNPLIKEVKTLDYDKNVIMRELKVIGSQIKQSVYNRMLDSIKALSNTKAKGNKVGALKFKSQINAIPLKQFDVTYRFHKSKPNYIKIQNIHGYLKVNGRKQIPQDAEFANATLVKRNKSFYLMATVYVPKTVRTFEFPSVGIDFGIESTITLSTGKKWKVDFPETKKIKRLRHMLSRKHGSKKGSKKSKSYFDNLNLVNKSLEKINNKKKDAKNKIVSSIVNTFETVCVQDENIIGWKEGLFGKQVHNSILGGIMSDLKRRSHTLIIIDRYDPTTMLCRWCFKLNRFGLEVRTYVCDCGYKEDRDTHSALTTEDIGLGRIIYEDGNWMRSEIQNASKDSFLGEHKELKAQVEGCTSARSFANNDVCETDSKSISMKPEAHAL